MFTADVYRDKKTTIMCLSMYLCSSYNLTHEEHVRYVQMNSFTVSFPINEFFIADV